MTSEESSADVKGVVHAILDLMNDRNDSVNAALRKSICKMATPPNTDVILISCCEYIKTKRKLNVDHGGNILGSIEQICTRLADKLSHETVDALLEVIIKEMTSHNEYIPWVQLPGSGIIANIGCYHSVKVIPPLLELFQPNVTPHYTIPHTIGSIAKMNSRVVVSYTREILFKMIPTFGIVKTDHLKQAYSYALAGLSVALMDHFNNADQGQQDINIDTFKNEFSGIYDILCNHWLNSTESKVTESILNAIGPMINLIALEKHAEFMPKLIPNVLFLYKKNNVPLYTITEALSYILKKSVDHDNLLTLSTVDTIIVVIFAYVHPLLDYEQPHEIKNHNEVLRCFDILLTKHPRGVLEFLYQRAKCNSEDERNKAVTVLTHLLSSVDKPYLDNFINLLKTMINTENSIKSKRVLLKGIVALSYRNCLHELNNSVLLDYISKHILLNNTNDLYDDCKESLILLSTAENDVKPLLWPILLEALIVSKKYNTTAVIAKCLLQLTEKIDLGNDALFKDRLTTTNEALFIRCLSLLNVTNLEVHVKELQSIIAFLLRYCRYIHKDLATNWRVDLNNLNTYLNGGSIVPTVWESMLIDLFQSALHLINDNRVIENILNRIIEQIAAADHNIAQKGILYKFMAVLMCNIFDAAAVDARLDIYFNALSNGADECKYLSEALGIIAVKHGIRVIDRIDEMCGIITSKKTNRFTKFAFIKSAKQEAEINNMKYAITLCYREIANELTDINILNKLTRNDVEKGGTALTWLTEILENQSSPPYLILVSLLTLNSLLKSIHSLSPDNSKFQDMSHLTNLILHQVIDRMTRIGDVEVFPTIIKTISSLFITPKSISPVDRRNLFRELSMRLFNLMLYLNERSKDGAESTIVQSVITNIQGSFEAFVEDLLVQSTCPSTLDDIISILDPWINHSNEDVRITAMKCVKRALYTYVRNIKLTFENPSRFNQSGTIMGRILSKCTDPSLMIRKLSIDSIQILISIINLYDGNGASTNVDLNEKVDAEQYTNADGFKRMLIELTNVICEKIEHQQIMNLIESLLDNMHVNNSYKQESCIVLNTIFKNKGPDLYQSVNRVMNSILSASKRMNQTKKEYLLRTMLTFVRHHTKLCVEFLLSQPLPFEAYVTDCWNMLAEDSAISVTTIDYLNDLLTTQPVYENTPHNENERVASVQCLSAVSGLCEIINQPHSKDICNNKFPELFSVLYSTLFCLIGTVPPAHTNPVDNRNERFGFVPNNLATKIVPVKLASDALKALLISSGCVKVFDILVSCEEMNSAASTTQFFDYISSMVRAFCEDYPQHVAKLVVTLNQHARSPLVPQRMAVTAFFSYLVSFRCNDNAVILETVIQTLNAGWKDTSLEVRAISLTGLGHIKYLKKEQREPFSESVVSSLYHALDDSQGSDSRTNVPLIAIVSLTELLSVEDDINNLVESYAPIAQRIKAFMNTQNPMLREASIKLFGEITLKQNSEAMKEQAFILLPCFLMHLADDNIDVVKACKQTLKKIAPSFDAPETNAMIQNHLIDTGRLQITNFLTDLTKCICNEMPANIYQLIESTFNYLNSPWDNIRGNACTVIGLLFANFNADQAGEVDFEKTRKLLTFRLLQLIKDNNSNVKIAAANALSGVYQSP